MNFLKKLAVIPGSKVDLSRIDPDETFGWDKEEARKQTAKNLDRIAALQDLLYAERQHNLLMVVQAMDTGGKDGTIKAIGGAMNPQGLRVANFKKPTAEELSHDFLWRIEKKMPGMVAEEKGEVVFFNRSHYEDVLIVRVHDSVPKTVWEKRYAQINDFEKKHADNGTHILKFFLHISKDEQLKRLKTRIETPEKNWKVGAADFAERQFWDHYQKAYEDALSKCSTAEAPWIVVPANHKWFRNLVISEITVRHLEGLQMQYPDNAATVEKARAECLAEENARSGQAKRHLNPNKCPKM